MLLHHLIEINQLQDQEFATIIDYKVEVVSILLDEDPTVVYNYKIEKVNAIYEKFTHALKNLQDYKGEIVLQGEKLNPLPFNHLTLGAFIDLETYCAEPKNIAKAIAVLYRKKLPVSPLDADEYEKYGTWVAKRAELLLNIPVQDVVGIQKAYLAWREFLLTKYTGLFDTYQGEDEVDDHDIVGKLEMERLRKEEEAAKAFSWERTILKMINQDASKFEQILEMPIIFVLNILAAQKTK